MVNMAVYNLKNIVALKLFSRGIDRNFPKESWWLFLLLLLFIYAKVLADSIILVLQFKDNKDSKYSLSDFSLHGWGNMCFFLVFVFDFFRFFVNIVVLQSEILLQLIGKKYVFIFKLSHMEKMF